jgi:hypothetical protein
METETRFDLRKIIEADLSDPNYPIKPPNNESRLANSGCIELLIQFDKVISFPDSFDRVNAFQQLINTARVVK